MEVETDEDVFFVEELNSSTAVVRTVADFSSNEPIQKEVPYRKGCAYTYVAGNLNFYNFNGFHFKENCT